MLNVAFAGLPNGLELSPPDRTRLTLIHFTATSLCIRVAIFGSGPGPGLWAPVLTARLKRVVRRPLDHLQSRLGVSVNRSSPKSVYRSAAV